MNPLFQMFSNTAHVEGNNDPSTQGILIEQRRVNPNFIALDVPFDEPDYLGQQVLAATLPGGFHLFVNIAGCRKYDLLGSEPFPKLPQADLRDPRYIGLALNDWGQLGKR